MSQESTDVFEEILGFPLRRDIYLSLDLTPRAKPIYETSNVMSEPKLKEL